MTLLSLSGTTLILLLLGVTLLVGFGADWLATRFRLPDVLWLIGLGLVAGPVLGLLTASSLLFIAPVLGTAALILILFEAGIDLRVSLIRPLAGSALLFAAASYAVSTAVLFGVSDLVLFPGHLVLSFLFAASLGCSSGAVIIPLAGRLGLVEGLRGMMHLDGAVEDALAIITVTTLLALVSPASPSLALNLTFSLILPLPVGVAIGFAGGLVWLLFLYGWQDRAFAALATLGFLLAVYSVAQALGGSGILAAIVFGAVLGNEAVLRRFLRRSRPFRISNDLRKVEVEIAFVLRAFFLFLIGVLAPLSNPGLVPAIAIGGLVLVLLALRRGVFSATTNPRKVPRSWASPVSALYGRGLTSAVLLTVALDRIPRVSELFFPGLLVIVGTNIAMTVWLFVQPPEAGREIPEASREWAAAATDLLSFAESGAGLFSPPPPLPAGPAHDPRTGGTSPPPPLPKGRGDRDR